MQIEKFKVEEWFNKYEKLAKYDLADTCIESMSINELLDTSNISNLDEILHKKLNYGDIQGSERLKTAISTMYKNISSSNITVTHGAIGANQLVYLSLIEAGDEVITMLPAYQQHYSIPEALGANVKKVFLKQENNWLPDINELKSLITDKTKLIIMTNPNNPTGSVIKDSLMKEIINIAKGAYILIDEVYRNIVREKEYETTSIADLYNKGISVSSLSKGFSLAGLRLGWIVTQDSQFMREINHQREYNTISVSILDDYFASIAIENKNKIFDRNIQKIKIGYSILSEWIKNNKYFSCVLPNGGTTAFINYNNKFSSYELCKKILNDTGILFLPGETLEMDKFLRIGYGNRHDRLKIALEILNEYMDNIMV